MSEKFNLGNLTKRDVEKIMHGLGEIGAYGIKNKLQDKIDEWEKRGRW